MSTHVIKRRAITTRHIAFHQNCAVFGGFFITGVALPRRVIQGFRAKNPRSRQAPVDNLLSNSIKLEKNAKNQTLNKGALPL